jgi:hypothetical protein
MPGTNPFDGALEVGAALTSPGPGRAKRGNPQLGWRSPGRGGPRSGLLLFLEHYKCARLAWLVCRIVPPLRIRPGFEPSFSTFGGCTALIGSVRLNRFLEVGPRAVLIVNLPQKSVLRFPVVRHPNRAGLKETQGRTVLGDGGVLGDDGSA